MWARSGHIACHMTTLDTQTWLREEVPGLGLTDEDVGLLRGWIMITWSCGLWNPRPSLNRINRIYIQQGAYFLEACLERTSRLSMLGPKKSWDRWPTEKSSRVCMSEDKVHTKDSCLSIGLVYNSRGLSGVSTYWASFVALGRARRSGLRTVRPQAWTTRD
jgi:hypothetical protein